MTATTVIQHASSLDVLAAIPASLGFHPVDSLVLCGVNPPRGRLGAMMRFDIAALGGRAAAPLIDRNVRRVRDAGAAAVFAVRYAGAGAPRMDRDPAVAAALARVRSVLPIVGLWSVGEGKLAEHHPVTGEPVGPAIHAERLQSTRAAAALVVNGLAPLARREDLARIELAPEAARRAARIAERRAADQAVATAKDKLGPWRLALLGCWDECLAQTLADPSTEPTPTKAGRIHALVCDPRGRDAILATPFKGSDEAPRRIALGRGGTAILDPFGSRGVDHDRATAALAVMARVLAHVSKRRRGHGYAAGAAWHWWLGSGAAAADWARSALDCSNAPDLATLLLTLLEHEVFPSAVTGLRSR
ncbi:MAG: DUF4192 domain-containing protein [Bifidobacteriaceae bacterium]|jgi:hypothetical protein|nr:DUF4192 domain-containing protein [Bifidobacteriaceae bacterium]